MFSEETPATWLKEPHALDTDGRKKEGQTKGYREENARRRNAQHAAQLAHSTKAGRRPCEVERICLMPCKTLQDVLGGGCVADLSQGHAWMDDIWQYSKGSTQPVLTASISAVYIQQY